MKSEQQSPHKKSDTRCQESTSGHVPSRNNLLFAAFRRVCEETNSSQRASLLVTFVKEYDFRGDSEILRAIRSWTQSDDEDLRREAVYSLCVIRPIEDRLSIARQAWPGAPAGDSHWYASALIAACDSPNKITLDLVLMVLQSLFTPRPASNSLGTDQDRLDQLDAEATRRWYICAAYSVITHFHAMFLHGLMNDQVYEASRNAYRSCARNELSEPIIDWKCVGEVLVRAASQICNEK